MFPHKEKDLRNTHRREDAGNKKRGKSHFQLRARVRSNRNLHPDDDDGDDNDDREGS